MRPRSTLLVPSGPSGLHLFVIVTNPCPQNSVLMFSVSRIKAGRYHDPTCTFVGGEHEFISAPSYVVYGKPEQRFLSGIRKCIDGKEFIPKSDLDHDHFVRMCDGIIVSPHRQPWAVLHSNRYR